MWFCCGGFCVVMFVVFLGVGWDWGFVIVRLIIVRWFVELGVLWGVCWLDV